MANGRLQVVAARVQRQQSRSPQQHHTGIAETGNPPLIIKPAEIDELFDGIKKGLDDALEEARKNGIAPA